MDSYDELNDIPEGLEDFYGVKSHKAKIEADYDRRQSARKDTVIDRLNAEITQLRAELAAMTAQANAEAMYSDGLRAELQAERELADRLREDNETAADRFGAIVDAIRHGEGGKLIRSVIEDWQAQSRFAATRRNK